MRAAQCLPEPIATPLDPAKVLELARAVVEADRFPYLATIDADQPRLRPVSPVRTDGFTVYVANLRMYHKTAEIAANPKVELCYLDNHHNQVRLTGVAEIVTDRGHDAFLLDVPEFFDISRAFLQSAGRARGLKSGG